MGGFQYAELVGGYQQALTIGQPVGVTTIELVDTRGVTVVPAQQLEVRLASQTTFWVHGSPEVLVGEELSFALDDDPTPSSSAS